jgi:hypothetical protein
MSTPDHRWELNSQIELRASPIDLVELNLPTIDHDHVSTSFWNPGENHQPVASHQQTSSHNVASSTPRHERGSN